MYLSLYLVIRGKGMLGLVGINYWILRFLEGNVVDFKFVFNILDIIL